MPAARAVQVNPANPEQALVLWSDGRVVPRGPGTPDPHFNANWDRGSWNNIGRDLIVTDWVTPSGYVLSGWGSIQRFGSATRPDAAGIKAPPYTIRQDFWHRLVMDPGGSGAGYVVSKTGLIAEFGGAPAVAGPTLPHAVTPGGLAGFGYDAVRDFQMDWATKKYAMLTLYGTIYTTTATGAITSYSFGSDVFDSLIVDGKVIVGHKVKRYDAARAIYVVDWDDLKGYVLDSWGRIHTFGNDILPPSVKPYWPNTDTARDLVVSSYPTSFQYTVLDAKGVTHLVTASTPPTVTITAPEDAATITETTRPTFAWEVADAQGDAQAYVEVNVYPGHGQNPNVSTPSYRFSSTDKLMRAVEVADITNGDWTVGIRVTEALGLSSAWATADFTMDVVPPSTPTVTYTVQPGNDNDIAPYVEIDVVADPTDEGCYVQLQIVDQLGIWHTVNRGPDVFIGADGTATKVFAEFQLVFGTAFRVRLVDVTSGGSAYRAGAWSDAEYVPPTTPTKDYWLTAIGYYGLDGGNQPVSTKVSVTAHESVFGRNQGVFKPLGGNQGAVVISDGGHWREHTLEIVVTNTQDIGKVVMIVNQGTFLMRGPQGFFTYSDLNGEIDINVESGRFNLYRITLPVIEVDNGFPEGD